MLEALERGNLFLVPLDDRRMWYRYHHLFADVLRARLRRRACRRTVAESCIVVPAQWYEAERRAGRGHPSRPRGRATSSGLPSSSSSRCPQTRRHRQEATLRRWLEALPRRADPRPTGAESTDMPGRAWCAARSRRRRIASPRDDGRARWLTAAASAAGRPGWSSWTRHRSATLPASIADPPCRTGPAPRRRVRHDPARPTRPRAHPPGRPPGSRIGDRRSSDSRTGRTADLDEAPSRIRRRMATWSRPGISPTSWAAPSRLADIRIAQGRLGEAMRIYRARTRARDERCRGPAARGCRHARRHGRDRSANGTTSTRAAAHLRASAGLGEENRPAPETRIARGSPMARIRAGRGRPGRALQLLEEAERLYVGDFSPDVQPVAGHRAHGCGSPPGRLAEAADVGARSRGLAADDDLTYLREFEHVTLATTARRRGTER